MLLKRKGIPNNGIKGGKKPPRLMPSVRWRPIPLTTIGFSAVKTCAHQAVSCLNHYDTFRKYLCQDCGGIYICLCERELATAFLPHQIDSAQEYGTRRRFPVSGFAPRMCAECRGEVEEPHPRAAIWGQKGKIERFYWREIFKTECELTLVWLREHGESVQDIIEFQSRFPKVFKEIQRDAKRHWQVLHRENPKYDLTERTEADFFSNIHVPTTEVEVPYVQVEKGDQNIGKWISPSGQQVGAEGFAEGWYSAQSFRVLRCERTLISAWVGTFLVDIVQDPSDPRQQECMRHSTRGWRSDRRDTPLISFMLPEDFGSAAYFERRRDAFEALIARMRGTPNLVDLFDQLVKPSELLRDYLWVNEDEAIETAREALLVLPTEIIVGSLLWAIQDFWERQSGWPDLFVYRGAEHRFVEVKSQHDRLSQEQMNWFEWAISEAHIPCEILRIKRAPQSST